MNTSSDPRNLRESYSSQLGLVCGYFFGAIKTPGSQDTPASYTVGGAGESSPALALRRRPHARAASPRARLIGLRRAVVTFQAEAIRLV